MTSMIFYIKFSSRPFNKENGVHANVLEIFSLKGRLSNYYMTCMWKTTFLSVSNTPGLKGGNKSGLEF